jgi:hypothetical protein
VTEQPGVRGVGVHWLLQHTVPLQQQRVIHPETSEVFIIITSQQGFYHPSSNVQAGLKIT